MDGGEAEADHFCFSRSITIARITPTPKAPIAVQNRNSIGYLLHLEAQLAPIEIRRQYLNPHGYRIRKRANHLLALVLIAGQNGAEELDGVMNLQIGRLVGEQSVARGM